MRPNGAPSPPLAAWSEAACSTSAFQLSGWHPTVSANMGRGEETLNEERHKKRNSLQNHHFKHGRGVKNIKEPIKRGGGGGFGKWESGRPRWKKLANSMHVRSVICLSKSLSSRFCGIQTLLVNLFLFQLTHHHLWQHVVLQLMFAPLQHFTLDNMDWFARSCELLAVHRKQTAYTQDIKLKLPSFINYRKIPLCRRGDIKDSADSRRSRGAPCLRPVSRMEGQNANIITLTFGQQL